MGDYEAVRIDLESRVEKPEKWKDVLKVLEKELLVLEKRAKKTGSVN